MTQPVVVRTPTELRRSLDGAGTVAFVPTMGALHEGHAQLLKHAAPLADLLVASIFVNPTQFAPGEDFADYPRTMDVDLERCAESGAAVVFVPSVEVMYPRGVGAATTIDPGPLGQILEGATRPTHFRGVLTVVAKFLNLVRPDIAVFGEKDYQQLTLIQLMATELCMKTEIIGAPTVREADGLAMSSRNRYLDTQQRRQATVLSRALAAGVAHGSEGADAVLSAARRVVDESTGFELDYLALTDPDLGDPTPGQAARLLIEGRIGTTRLLDNTGLTLGT